jgi:cell division protein FtsL
LSGQAYAAVLLSVTLFISALSVVYVKHQSRKLFVELQVLQTERDHMNVEWGQLQLEQSTLVAHGRIERIARSKLGMSIPSSDALAIIRP